MVIQRTGNGHNLTFGCTIRPPSIQDEVTMSLYVISATERKLIAESELHVTDSIDNNWTGNIEKTTYFVAAEYYVDIKALVLKPNLSSTAYSRFVIGK